VKTWSTFQSKTKNERGKHVNNTVELKKATSGGMNKEKKDVSGRSLISIQPLLGGTTAMLVVVVDDD